MLREKRRPISKAMARGMSFRSDKITASSRTTAVSTMSSPSFTITTPTFIPGVKLSSSSVAYTRFQRRQKYITIFNCSVSNVYVLTSTKNRNKITISDMLITIITQLKGHRTKFSICWFRSNLVNKLEFDDLSWTDLFSDFCKGMECSVCHRFSGKLI